MNWQEFSIYMVKTLVGVNSAIFFEVLDDVLHLSAREIQHKMIRLSKNPDTKNLAQHYYTFWQAKRLNMMYPINRTVK